MLENRLNDLESKFTFQDELLAELNDLVTKQQMAIDGLQRQVKLLTTSANMNATGDSNNSNERPPHY